VAALALLAGACASTGPDPLEPANRKIFWFNEQVDMYVLEPVARGWDWALPDWTQRGIRNFFGNLTRPASLAINLLQLKPRAALEEFLRLLTNTTFGIMVFVRSEFR